MPWSSEEQIETVLEAEQRKCVQSLSSRAASAGWTVESLVSNGSRRLLVIPQQHAAFHRIGVISSRLSRKFDEWSDWFRALRSSVAGINNKSELAVVASGTTTAAMVDRAAAIFGKKVLTLQLPLPNEALDDWCDRVKDALGLPPHQPGGLFLSPKFGIDVTNRDETSRPIPTRDQAMFDVCDTIVALHVRGNGFTFDLLKQRLESQTVRPGRTQIALGQRLVADKLRDQLMDAGAVGIAILPAPHELPKASGDESHDLTVESFAEPNGDWTYLAHCTRRRSGPWPDQTKREYLDDLILDRPSAQHAPIDSLKHILKTNRLVASSGSIRGTTEVVCFTGVPLAELRALRVFRPHRGRWDFEPYGICIRKRCLQHLGAAPVNYVATSEAKSLSELPETHVQRAESRTKSGSTMDWTVEQEWRHVGDLSLDDLAGDDAFLFVSTMAEAHAIQPLSRWPVAVLGGDSDS